MYCGIAKPKRVGTQSAARRLSIMLLGTGLTLTLGGCLLTDQPEPGLDIPARYTRSSANPQIAEAALPKLDWWRGFRSRELTEIVEQARESNLDIAAAISRVIQADANSRVAGAALLPAIDLLVPFAHWITPVNLPKRFDTHFLLAMAPADQIGRHDGNESVDSVWLSPKEALAAAESGRFNLPFPTVRNLIKLDKLGTAQAAIDFARRTPVVTVVPEMSRTESGATRLRIPIEAGYDGDIFEVMRP